MELRDYVAKRMGIIYKRLGISGRSNKGKLEDIFVLNYKLDGNQPGTLTKNANRENDIRWMLAEGDTQEYKAIGKLSMQDFLIKYDRFSKQVEHNRQQASKLGKK